MHTTEKTQNCYRDWGGGGGALVGVGSRNGWLLDRGGGWGWVVVGRGGDGDEGYFGGGGERAEGKLFMNGEDSVGLEVGMIHL